MVRKFLFDIFLADGMKRGFHQNKVLDLPLCILNPELRVYCLRAGAETAGEMVDDFSDIHVRNPFL